MRKLKEETEKRNLIYKGKAVDFYADTVILPNKKTAIREYIKHPGAVSVVPFLDRKRIILIRQYRYPVKKILLELPAGKINKGESPLRSIKRELEEETGYKAKNWKKIFTYYPSCAFSTEALHIYMAWNLIFTGKNPDEDEFIERVIIDYKTALKLVEEGKILDSKTVIGLLICQKFLKLL